MVQDKKITCLFCAHLLPRFPHNPIALVEAPKTALYGTLYFGFPEVPTNFTWLAVYNKSSFSLDKLRVLEGRDIYVFPDLSKDGHTYNEWLSKAKDFEGRLLGARFIFSDLLEQLAPETDKGNGNDLADYLIKLDWRQFRSQARYHEVIEKPEPALEPIEAAIREKCEKCEAPKEIIFSTPFDIKDKTQTSNVPIRRNWQRDILELDEYFRKDPEIPKTIRLNQCSTITDVSRFIESHLVIIKSNTSMDAILPYLDRLKELRRLLGGNGHPFDLPL